MAGRGFLLQLPLLVLLMGVVMGEVAHGDDNVLSLNNTGPAVVHTPILFFANLKDFEPGEKLKWMWSDSFGNRYIHNGGGPTASWNMTYESIEHSNCTRTVTVTLDVLKYYLSVWMDRAIAKTSFLLSDALSLSHTGPAVLDTPIFFFADLKDFQPGEELKWMWSDSLGNQYSHIGGGPTASWNMTYKSIEHWNSTQTVTVTLDVLKYYLSLWTGRACAETSFPLSGHLFGELTYRQINVTIPKPGLIATTNQTNLTVALTDPYDWLKQHTESVSFSWVINDVELTQCHSPSLIVNITEPGDHNIQVKVILDLSDEIITSMTTTTTTTTSNTTARPTPKPKKWQCDGYWPQFGYIGNRFRKLGHFNTTIKAVEPIGHINLTGNTWLKHGELAELTVLCSGSPAIGYCKGNYWGVHNITGHEKCGEDEIIMTPTCNISIVSHFPENATRTIVLVMFNDISKVVYPITINIYNVDRKPELLYIIIPVIIIIIVFGIRYFIRRRSSYGREGRPLIELLYNCLAGAERLF